MVSYLPMFLALQQFIYMLLLILQVPAVGGIPQPSLGLAFSPHDFIIALRLWLGVPLFPLLTLCTCLSVIGDHLLGCS